MTQQDQDRAAFEAWLRVKPCGAAHDFAWEAWQAAIAHDRQRQTDWHRIADERAAEIVRLDGLLDRQQRTPEVTDDMRMAIRFAPSSAHWSKVLIEIFGPDAREGIEALEKQLHEAQQQRGEPILPEGFRLIAVNAGFDSLMHWLVRCERKGHLENCPDLIGPWEAFDYREVEAPQPTEQQRGEPVGHVAKDSSAAHMHVNLPEGTPVYAATPPADPAKVASSIQPIGYIAAGVIDLLREQRFATLCPSAFDGGLPVYLAAPSDCADHFRGATKMITRDEIRAVLLKRGYTIKPGETDLREYVYAAAYELMDARAGA